MIQRYEEGSMKDVGVIRRYSAEKGSFVECSFARKWDSSGKWIDMWLLEKILEVNLPNCIYEYQSAAVENLTSFDTMIVNLETKDTSDTYNESFWGTHLLSWDSDTQVIQIPGIYYYGTTEAQLDVEYMYSDTYNEPEIIYDQTRVCIDYKCHITVIIELLKESNTVRISCDAQLNDFTYEYSFPDLPEPNYWDVQLTDSSSVEEVIKQEMDQEKIYEKAEESTLTGQITFTKQERLE